MYACLYTHRFIQYIYRIYTHIFNTEACFRAFCLEQDTSNFLMRSH